MINNKRNKKAVSELVGVILLLAISISLFSIVNIMVFSYPFNPRSSSVNLYANFDSDNNVIIIKNNYGDPLDLQTKIVIVTDSGSITHTVGEDNYLSDKNGDHYWSIGEYVKIPPPSSINGKFVVMIFDHANNQMIMKTEVQ